MRATIFTRCPGPATTAAGTFGLSTHSASYVAPCAAVSSFTLSGRNSHGSCAASRICSALLSKIDVPSDLSVSRVMPTRKLEDMWLNHEGREEREVLSAFAAFACFVVYAGAPTNLSGFFKYHCSYISRPFHTSTPFCLRTDRKSTRLNSSHGYTSYAVF